MFDEMPLSISRFSSSYLSSQRKRVAFSSLFRLLVPTVLKPQIEQGDLARARLTLRGLASIVDEGYIDPILQQLQEQVADSRFSN